VLRHTSKAFAEDPLRVYRVARFAATFDFRVAPETLALMTDMKAELFALKVERVWKEFEKVLHCQTPGRFFEVLNDAGVLDVHFQEVAALHVPDKHDGTAFLHTLKVMNAGQSAMERFGLFVHDFGKGRTPKKLHPAHPRHEHLGKDAVLAFCQRLRVSKAFETFGVLCATQHIRVKQANEMRHGTFVRWVLSLKHHLDPVVRVSFLDSVHREGASYDDEAARFQNVLRLVQQVKVVEAQVTGKTLLEEGRTPGKQFGELLFQRRVEAFKQRLKS
jgi:tRNA nucleotidyltransferase (CCA-adding enzyme)